MIWHLILPFGLLVLILIPLMPAFIELHQRKDASSVKIIELSQTDIWSYARGFRNFLKNKFPQLFDEDLVFLSEKKQEGNAPVSFIYLPKAVARQELITDQEKLQFYTPKLYFCKEVLELPSNMLFEGEVYGAGGIVTGRNNFIKAALSDGEIIVQDNVEVLRWMAARKAIQVNGKATFHGRLSSQEQIFFQENALFKWLEAPKVHLASAAGVTLLAGSLRDENEYDTTPIEDIAEIIDISAGRTYINGDLKPPENWRHEGDLVVSGSLFLQTGSLMLGKIKTQKDLVIGKRCSLLSSIASRRNISVSSGSVICGPVMSEGDIFINAAQIGYPENLTSVYGVNITLTGKASIFGSVFAEKDGIIKPKVDA